MDQWLLIGHGRRIVVLVAKRGNLFGACLKRLMMVCGGCLEGLFGGDIVILHL